MLKRSLVTGSALAALVTAVFAAVQVTAEGSRIVCLPPAVVQALS